MAIFQYNKNGKKVSQSSHGSKRAFQSRKNGFAYNEAKLSFDYTGLKNVFLNN